MKTLDLPIDQPEIFGPADPLDNVLVVDFLAYVAAHCELDKELSLYRAGRRPEVNSHSDFDLLERLFIAARPCVSEIKAWTEGRSHGN